MNESSRPDLHAQLDDLLGQMQFARRREDLGRLALLTYWEVRRWARAARCPALAERSSRIIVEHPHPTRDDFLQLVDGVIAELEDMRRATH